MIFLSDNGSGRAQRQAKSRDGEAERNTILHVSLGSHGACFALVFALGLLGCGSEEANSRDRALVVVVPREVQEIDPRLCADVYGLKVSRLVFASLVAIDPNTLEPTPDLAERVDAVSPAEYRVALRKGLRFSDGSALDAADVAATFRSAAAPDIGSRYASTYRRIARIETPDAHSVIFKLDGPHATFLTDLELPVVRAEDEHRALGPGAAPPIGAGPFRLKTFTPSRMELEANPFWHRGRPRFDRVTLLVVRDDNTRALRMLAGEADLVINAIPPLLVPMFLSDRRFQVRTAPGIGTTYLGINTESGPLSDPRVRRAIAYAVDRQLIIRYKFGGRARPARGLIPPGHWAYFAGVPEYGYDPSRARKLLEEAGLAPDPRTGARLTLIMRVGSDRFRQSIARVIADMLGQAGINVDIRPTELATLIADLDQGRFDLTTLQLPELIEPHVLSWFFGSDHIPGREGNQGANRWRLRDSALDAALEAGRRTVDRSERYRAYQEVQRILAEQLPVVPLWHEDVTAVANRRAGSFTVPRDARLTALAWR